MPHDLSIATDGSAEMFYVGDTPWHGLGTRLDNPASSSEAITASGLDWEVEMQPLYRRTPEDTLYAIDDRYSVVRVDTGVVLNHCVSDKYTPLQNREAFEFFDAMLGDAEYHTAGALKNGGIVWILAKMPQSSEVVPGDQIDNYILLSTSHDGSASLRLATTPIRVVCSNTLRFALSRSKHTLQMKHTQSISYRVVEAREALNLSQAYFTNMMSGLERLAEARMSLSEVKLYTDAVLNVDPDAEKIHTMTDEARNSIFELFYTGRGNSMPGVSDTAYAALNATTEYLDNYCHVNVPDANQDSTEAQSARLYKSWFSRGQDVRNRSWNLLQAFATNGKSAFENTYTPRIRNTRRSTNAVL